MDRIWYVDDEELNFRMDRKRIQRGFPGAEVRYFPTCEDALEASRSALPDAIVLDEFFAASAMQGHDLLAALGQARDAGRRVVMVTANPSEALREAVSRMGVSAFLVKPVQTPDLLDAIRKAVGGEGR